MVIMSREYIGMFYLLISYDVNIALNKPTTMSSIFVRTGYNCCHSDLAVDGKKALWEGDIFMCAHTDRNDHHRPWWAVDLLNVYDINVIDIYGRTDDCCPNDLENFDVEIIMPTCSKNLDKGNIYHCQYQATGSQRITIDCSPNTRGRIVRIKRRDKKAWVICEIEIYGDQINSLLQSGASLSKTAYACGRIGYGCIGPVLDTSVAKNDIQCTRKCIAKTACTAAEYDKKTNVCTLKGEFMNGTKSFLFQDIDKDVYIIP